MNEIRKFYKEFFKDVADVIRAPYPDDLMIVPKHCNRNTSCSARVRRREKVKCKNNSNGES